MSNWEAWDLGWEDCKSGRRKKRNMPEDYYYGWLAAEYGLEDEEYEEEEEGA